MADLQSNVITITTDDLLRLNFTAAEISHIFKTLATDPKGADANNRILTIEDNQIIFKNFLETNIPNTLGIETAQPVPVTENVGGYSQGDTIPADTKVLDILTNLLRKFKKVTESDVSLPAIDFTIQGTLDDSENTIELSEPEIIKELEVGTEINFTNLQIKPFLGSYTWGPEKTGVVFNELQFDVTQTIVDQAERTVVVVENYRNNDVSFTEEIAYDITGFPQMPESGRIASGINNFKVTVRSSHTPGDPAYNNDKTASTIRIEAGNALDLPNGEIAAASAITEKEYRVNGYFNSAYIVDNDADFRAGQHFKDLPASFVYEGELKTLYIAIKNDLGKEIKSITNKRTGIPQPFTKLESEIDIAAKSAATAAYKVYKIANKLAESSANEEYQIIYE